MCKRTEGLADAGTLSWVFEKEKKPRKVRLGGRDKSSFLLVTHTLGSSARLYTTHQEGYVLDG